MNEFSFNGHAAGRERADALATEGDHYGLTPDVSREIAERVCQEATDQYGRFDENRARARFREVAARALRLGGRLRRDPGKGPAVGASAEEGDAFGHVAPGRGLTLVEREQRRIASLRRRGLGPGNDAGLPGLDVVNAIRSSGLRAAPNLSDSSTDGVGAEGARDGAIAARGTGATGGTADVDAPVAEPLPAAAAASASLFDGAVEWEELSGDAARPQNQPDDQSQPLPYQADMERAFDQPLGHVRARTGQAAELAPLGAQALTVGSEVMFADAQPSPALVAHETTHAIQNEHAGASAAMASGVVAPRDSEAEAEADGNAVRVAERGLGERLPPVNAAPGAHVQLATAAPSRQLRPEEGLDPGAEATILGLLNRPLAADDAAGIQAQVRQLTAVMGAIPSDARMALHARLAAGAKGDALATAFHGRLHRSVRARLLSLLRGEPVPLPVRTDAMTSEAFAAKLPAHPIAVQPDTLAVSRFVPEVAAKIELRSELGPPSDEPRVIAIMRVYDAESAEHGVERVSWPTAVERSAPAEFRFDKPGKYRLEIEVIQGGLLIAQRQRELEVKRPQTDAEAVAAMSTEQLQEVHENLGDKLAQEGMTAEQRGAIGSDRNLIEFFATGKGVPLERKLDAPDAITVNTFDPAGGGMRDIKLSKDPVFVRQWIEQVFRAQGTGEPQDLAGVNRMLGAVDYAADSEEKQGRAERARYIREQIAPVVSNQITLFRAELKEFEDRFGKAAKAKLAQMLDESSATARQELVNYGITTTGGEITHDQNDDAVLTPVVAHGANTAKAQAMAKAAGELTANQRTMDDMRARLKSLNLSVAQQPVPQSHAPSPLQPHDETCRIDDADNATADQSASLHAQLQALQRLVVEAESNHAKTIEKYTKDYPILAAYKVERDGHVDMDASKLEKLQGSGRAQVIYEQIAPVLRSITMTRLAMDGINVWREPRIIQRTMPDFAIAPGSLHAKMIEDKTARVSRDEGSLAILAITFALALITAIPTGGSSLAAGAVVAAEIGGAALDIYLLAGHLKEYGLDKAKTGTDLDKAKVISAKEPSLFWLAVDIVGTGVGLAFATKTFREVADKIAAAKAHKLAREDAEIAVARVHAISREGKLGADAAERAEREILGAGAEGAQDATRVADGRTRVTSERVDELSERIGVSVEIDNTGKLRDGVELHYASRADGGIDPLVVRVGPHALIEDILAHQHTVRRITRYNGAIGKLRLLWDRLIVFAGGTVNKFPPGSKEWEAFEELSKLDHLIAMRKTARMGDGVVDPEILEHEIKFLAGYRAHHEKIVVDVEKSGKYGKGAGHIDSPDGWRGALGGKDDPTVHGMHEIDPAGKTPHQTRLPEAKPIDPNVRPDKASSGFWHDEHAKGNTDWWSDNERVNSITKYRPVKFKDGYPILDEYAQETVYLNKMVGDKRDFAPADREMARRHKQFKRDGTPNQTWAKDYRETNRLTWHHHQDGVRMQLVPFDLHSNIPHAGGASATRDAGNMP